MRRAIATALLAALPTLLAGCVARQPGAAIAGGGDLPPRLAADAWPRRYTPHEIHDGHANVFQIASSRGGPPPERSPVGEMGLGSLSRVEVERLVEPEELERFRRERGFREWLVFETYLRFAETTATLAPPREVRSDSRRERIRLVEISETSFAIYLPDGPPRGLVLQMTNLAGNTDWERQLTAEFRSRGWAVLSTFVPDGWAFGEEVRVSVGEGAESVGRKLAAAIDDRLAEWAYGVEAVLDYMQRHYPEVPQQPLVGVGSSAGAIALPAVAARLPRPFDCAVLIGGGINELAVLRRTSLLQTPIRLSWVDNVTPTTAQWEEIERAYLEHVRLDGVRTVAYLVGRPVLLLHAAWDRIVDASCGDQLWEALGRPERWCYQAGHLGLFFLWLPMEKGKIADWVDRQVG